MTLSHELCQGHSATGENKRDMAYVLKSGIRVFSQFQTMTVKTGRLASLGGLISRRWVAAGSSEHTLAVRQQIQDARKRGQEAGGEKRIESQHKKVVEFYCQL